MKNKLFIYRNCFTGDVSGGDTHMSGLVTWLLTQHALQADITYIRPRNDGQEKAYPEMNSVKNLTYTDSKVKSSTALMYLIRAFKTVTSIKIYGDQYSHIVASSHFIPDVIPAFFAANKKITRIVFIHHIIQDMDRPKSLNNTLANLQEKLCFYLIKKRFQKVIVVNQMVANRLRQQGFKKQEILLSSNFVVAAPKPVKFASKDITLAFCGRMVKQKGIYDFIDTCKYLLSLDNNFQAVMIGAGPELKKIKKIIESENLPIRTTGYIDDSVKFDLISRSKLFVFPSREEGWGIAIAEALICGTPVLAYKLPVYKPVFGSSITVCKKVADIKYKAAELLSEFTNDLDMASRRQSEIIKFAEDFTVDKVAKREYEFIVSDTSAVVKEPILLLGSYGRGNIGDDVFLLAAIELFKNKTIYVNSAHDHLLPIEVKDKVSTVSTTSIYDIVQKIRVFIKARYIIYWGGDVWVKWYENRWATRPLFQMLFLNTIARLMNKNVYYIGCGIGDLKGYSLVLARLSARLATKIIAREQRSAQLLKLPGISVLPDIAVNLPFHKPYMHKLPKDNEQMIIGISLLYHVPQPRINFYLMIEEIGNLIRMSSKSKYKFVLLPMLKGKGNYNDDLWASTELVKLLPAGQQNVEIVKLDSLQDSIEWLGRCHLVIGARLHANILASLNATPCIGISYRPKVASFFKDNNIDEYCLPITQLSLLEEKFKTVIDTYSIAADTFYSVSQSNLNERQKYQKLIDSL